MKKKIFCLLLVLIMPLLLLAGCGQNSTSMYTYTDVYCDDVFSVKIQDDNNEWVEYVDIHKYVLADRIGLVYLYRYNGEVIITHIENVIIYCK